MKQATRQAVLAAVADYLSLLEAPSTKQQSLHPSARVPLSSFRYAEPDDPDLGDVSGLAGVQRTIYRDEDDNPARWLPAFDVATVGPGGTAAERLVLFRGRTLQPRETRGRIHPWTPHAAALYVGRVSASGAYCGSQLLYGYIGGSWRIVDATVDPQRRLERDAAGLTRPDGTPDIGTLNILHQIAVYRRVLWHVALGYTGGGASLLVPIDARAILDLFRYRELPAGKKRRDALLHWVAEHWRRTLTPPDQAAYVHEHLRGQTRFEWAGGLWVQIMPSAEDKKRIKAGHKHEVTPSAPT